MAIFNVSMTRTTTEYATVEIEADTQEAANEIAMDRYLDIDGQEFDDEFVHSECVVTIDDQDDQDGGISRDSRVKKIERLIQAGDYEEVNAVRDILADLRHYCDKNGIVYMTEDKAAYQHYLHENKYCE